MEDNMCKMTDALHSYIGKQTYVGRQELLAFEAGYQAGHADGWEAARPDDAEMIKVIICKPDATKLQITELQMMNVHAAALAAVAEAQRRATATEHQIKKAVGEVFDAMDEIEQRLTAEKGGQA